MAETPVPTIIACELSLRQGAVLCHSVKTLFLALQFQALQPIAVKMQEGLPVPVPAFPLPNQRLRHRP